MANKIKGEVSLPFNGTDYTCSLNFNALADFEDETGKSVGEAIGQMQTGRINAKDMRALIWAGLKQHHPDITLQLAGQILSANPQALDRGMIAGFPEAEAGTGKAPRGKAKG